MDTEIRISTEGWPWEENSPAPPTGTRTRDLSITGPAPLWPLSYPRSRRLVAFGQAANVSHFTVGQTAVWKLRPGMRRWGGIIRQIWPFEESSVERLKKGVPKPRVKPQPLVKPAFSGPVVRLSTFHVCVLWQYWQVSTDGQKGTARDELNAHSGLEEILPVCCFSGAVYWALGWFVRHELLRVCCFSGAVYWALGWFVWHELLRVCCFSGAVY